jgi:hypothetical protein
LDLRTTFVPRLREGETMTCIVGVVENGRVFIGGDSGAFVGWSANIRTDSKVFESAGFIYGVCGTPRVNQILRYVFEPPAYVGGDPMAYMVCQFVPKLREVMARELSDAAKSELPNSSFLVGFAGRLFEVWGDFQIAEAAEGFSSVGCARDTALGALFVASKCFGARVSIGAALEAAAALNAGVRSPFVILESEP